MIANFIMKLYVYLSALIGCPIFAVDSCFISIPGTDPVPLTHLVTPVEGISSPGHLKADEALAGDERTAPGEGGGAPGVISTRVGQTWILLAGGGRDTESKC